MIGFIILSLILLLSLYFYFCNGKNYLEKAGVPCPKGYPIVGHLFDMYMKKTRWIDSDKNYHKYKEDGMYVLDVLGSPNVHLTDLDIIKDVMVREFDSFADRRSMGSNDKRVKEMLFTVQGEDWKHLRAALTPTFSSGKIKGMFNLVTSIADEHCTRIGMDMEDQGFFYSRLLAGFFNMDVIAAISFGIDTNCLKNRDVECSEFIKMANEFMSPSAWTLVKMTFMPIFPKLSAFLGMDIPLESCDFMEEVIKKTVQARQAGGKKRGDFLDLLLELKDGRDKDPTKKYNFTMNTVISQSILFLLAGFDTTANAVAFTSYHLAKNVEKQDILREELKKMFQEKEDFNYQNIYDCPYLDAVLCESLRVHTPAFILERDCTKDFKLKNRDVTIKKGTVVTILPHSIHHDPQYWKDPEEFQPERFLPENKSKIVSFSYMPFGQGPRSCIATRFAQMTAKICLAKLILNYELTMKPGCDEIQYASSYDVIKPEDQSIKLIATKING